MQTILRSEARAAGLERYFTGKPCKFGHISERYTSSADCILCKEEKHKLKDPADARRRAGDWYRNNRERAIKRSTEWAENNPEKRKSILSKWHEENKEQSAEAGRLWRENNREKSNDISRRYREDHPVERKASRDRWRRKNPDKCKANVHVRRARVRNAPGRFTSEDVKNIYRLQGGKCAYCREALHEKYQIDHIRSLSSGGTNSKENIQLLCSRRDGCNQRKGRKDPVDFARQLGLLV